jgi:hypothetical protein
MNPNLEFARTWVLKGMLRISDICDIVVDYAKDCLPDFHHGSKILILGGERKSRTTLLKDLYTRKTPTCAANPTSPMVTD